MFIFIYRDVCMGMYVYLKINNKIIGLLFFKGLVGY